MITAPRPLRPDDDSSDFNCGQPGLDNWLKQVALPAAKRGTAITYAAVTEGRVAGYYSLSSHSIQRSSAGGWLSRNTPDPIPAVLLGRLAVDIRHQGQGLGWSLLADAIRLAKDAGTKVGIRALVDPIDDQAARFYAHYGFRPFPADTSRLYIPLTATSLLDSLAVAGTTDDVDLGEPPRATLWLRSEDSEDSTAP